MMPGQDGEVVGFDREHALNRVGGDLDLLKEVAGLFVEEYPRAIEEIRAAVRAGDPQLVMRSAHSLKGAVGNFTDDLPYKKALDLEMIGRSGDLSGAPDAFHSLESVMEAFLPSLLALSSATEE